MSSGKVAMAGARWHRTKSSISARRQRPEASVCHAGGKAFAYLAHQMSRAKQTDKHDDEQVSANEILGCVFRVAATDDL